MGRPLTLIKGTTFYSDVDVSVGKIERRYPTEVWVSGLYARSFGKVSKSHTSFYQFYLYLQLTD